MASFCQLPFPVQKRCEVIFYPILVVFLCEAIDWSDISFWVRHLHTPSGNSSLIEMIFLFFCFYCCPTIRLRILTSVLTDRCKSAGERCMRGLRNLSLTVSLLLSFCDAFFTGDGFLISWKVRVCLTLLLKFFFFFIHCCIITLLFSCASYLHTFSVPTPTDGLSVALTIAAWAELVFEVKHTSGWSDVFFRSQSS